MTEHEIDAWFHLVDTNDDHTVTAAELDTANRVFDAKCNLPDQVNILFCTVAKSQTQLCLRYHFFCPKWVSEYDSNHLPLVHKKIEAEDFFKAGDRNKDGFLTEAELDDDFHS